MSNKRAPPPPPPPPKLPRCPREERETGRAAAAGGLQPLIDGGTGGTRAMVVKIGSRGGVRRLREGGKRGYWVGGGRLGQLCIGTYGAGSSLSLGQCPMS
jgi:hypothetical protein